MRKIKSFILLLITTLILVGCTTEEEGLVKSEKTYFDYFSTVISLSIWSEEELTESQWEDIENILQDVQTTFSRNEEGSELYALNQSAGTGEPYTVSPELYRMIKLAINYAELTDGKFDPTIGPLVDLWGFGVYKDADKNRESRAAPSPEKINEVLTLVDYELIEFDDENKTVTLPIEGMEIDLGAIAKGYATDEMVNYLRSQGINNAILNMGGNIYALGIRHSPNEDGSYSWTIGIRDPKAFLPTISLILLHLYDKTVVTSGTYEQYFVDPNSEITYHHILDPDTGYPVDKDPNTEYDSKQLASVSIITTSSTDADALSTSIFALGLERGKEVVESMPGIEAIFITKDNSIYKTSGIDHLYNIEVSE